MEQPSYLTEPSSEAATGSEAVAFCCGRAHNCTKRDKSCAMRGDVLGREHERGRPADAARAQDAAARVPFSLDPPPVYDHYYADAKNDEGAS